jgi:hypothetical protein
MRPPILCPLLSCLESVTSLPSCPTATHRGRGASAAWTLPVESRSVRAMRPDLQAPQTWSGARHRSEIDHAALAFSGDFFRCADCIPSITILVMPQPPSSTGSFVYSRGTNSWLYLLCYYTAAQSVNQSGLAPRGSVGSVCEGRVDVHALMLCSSHCLAGQGVKLLFRSLSCPNVSGQIESAKLHWGKHPYIVSTASPRCRSWLSPTRAQRTDGPGQECRR